MFPAVTRQQMAPFAEPAWRCSQDAVTAQLYAALRSREGLGSGWAPGTIALAIDSLLEMHCRLKGRCARICIRGARGGGRSPEDCWTLLQRVSRRYDRIDLTYDIMLKAADELKNLYVSLSCYIYCRQSAHFRSPHAFRRAAGRGQDHRNWR